MRIGIKILQITLMLLLRQSADAQNHLVTHNFIRQKVTEGYFTQKPGTTIPQDNFCISKTEAVNWLYLDESYLPSDNRMPWWSEIVPLPSVSRQVTVYNQSWGWGSCIVEISGLQGFSLQYQICPGDLEYYGSYTASPTYIQATVNNALFYRFIMIVNGVEVEAYDNNEWDEFPRTVYFNAYHLSNGGDVYFMLE